MFLSQSVSKLRGGIVYCDSIPVHKPPSHIWLLPGIAQDGTMHRVISSCFLNAKKWQTQRPDCGRVTVKLDSAHTCLCACCVPVVYERAPPEECKKTGLGTVENELLSCVDIYDTLLLSSKHICWFNDHSLLIWGILLWLGSVKQSSCHNFISLTISAFL